MRPVDPDAGETRRRQQARWRDQELRRRLAEYDREMQQMRMRLKVDPTPDGDVKALTAWVAEANTRRASLVRAAGDLDLTRAMAAIEDAERRLQELLARRRSAATKTTSGGSASRTRPSARNRGQKEAGT